MENSVGKIIKARYGLMVDVCGRKDLVGIVHLIAFCNWQWAKVEIFGERMIW